MSVSLGALQDASTEDGEKLTKRTIDMAIKYIYEQISDMDTKVLALRKVPAGARRALVNGSEEMRSKDDIKSTTYDSWPLEDYKRECVEMDPVLKPESKYSLCGNSSCDLILDEDSGAYGCDFCRWGYGKCVCIERQPHQYKFYYFIGPDYKDVMITIIKK